MARAAADKAKNRKTSASPPFERGAFLLQGGGALGASQGGVYQRADNLERFQSFDYSLET